MAGFTRRGRFGRKTLLVFSLLAFPVQAGQSWYVRAETSLDYDTNAARRFQDVEGDWLNRALVNSGWSGGFGKHRLSAEALLGGKAFWKETDQDVLLWRISTEWVWSVGHNFELGADGIYHDSVMNVHLRDWRQLQGRGWFKFHLNEWMQMRLWLGGAWLVFKPDDTDLYQVKLSHAGPSAGGCLSLFPEWDSTADLFYELELSWFGYRALGRYQGVLVQSGEPRRDLLHQAGMVLRRRIAGVSWQLVGEIAWTVLVRDSNSFGSSALRHRLRLALAIELSLGLAAQLLGSMQFSSFPDGMYLEGNVYQPDADENENSLAMRIQWELWQGFGIYFQAAIYRSAFRAGSLPQFARETVGGGVFYEKW